MCVSGGKIGSPANCLPFFSSFFSFFYEESKNREKKKKKKSNRAISPWRLKLPYIIEPCNR